MISESQLSIPDHGLRMSVLFNDVEVHKVGDLEGRNPARLYQRLINSKAKPIDYAFFNLFDAWFTRRTTKTMSHGCCSGRRIRKQRRPNKSL